MVYRIAGASAFLVFAVSVIAGIDADNTFSTIVLRALLAMAATWAIGMVVGGMAQKMLDEKRLNLQAKAKMSSLKPPTTDK